MSKLDCILIWFTKLAPNVQILKWNREIYLQKKVGIVFILTYIKMRAAGFKLAAACRHHSCCNFVVSVVESISRIYRTLSLLESFQYHTAAVQARENKRGRIFVFSIWVLPHILLISPQSSLHSESHTKRGPVPLWSLPHYSGRDYSILCNAWFCKSAMFCGTQQLRRKYSRYQINSGMQWQAAALQSPVLYALMYLS